MHRYPRIKIVHLNWLLMSASSWRRLNESSYLLDEPHGDPFSPPNGIDPFDPRALLSSDEDDDDDEEALSLPSAGVANVRGETPDPDLDEEDVDIGEFDWGDADKEVNDFLAEMGEDGAFTTDESDNERYSIDKGSIEYSVASNNSRRAPNKRKRKRDGESSRETSDAEDSDGDGIVKDHPDHLRSRLAKRIHSAKSRKSHLSNSVTVPSKGSSAVPSPNGSSGLAIEEPPGSANGSNGHYSADDGDGEDSDLDDWADEFEKELG